MYKIRIQGIEQDARYPFLEDAILDAYNINELATVHKIADFGFLLSEQPIYKNNEPIPDWVFSE